MRLLPGLQPSADMARRLEARGLRRLHRHGRPLTVGAKEDETLAPALCEMLQQAVRLQAFLNVGIGDVQRAGDDPILAPLLVLPEVD